MRLCREAQSTDFGQREEWVQSPAAPFISSVIWGKLIGIWGKITHKVVVKITSNKMMHVRCLVWLVSAVSLRRVNTFPFQHPQLNRPGSGLLTSTLHVSPSSWWQLHSSNCSGLTCFHFPHQSPRKVFLIYFWNILRIKPILYTSYLLPLYFKLSSFLTWATATNSSLVSEPSPWPTRIFH